MKKIKAYLSIVLISTKLICYGSIPDNFSYASCINLTAYDQIVQGPCFSFATVAGIEAMYYMYYGGPKNNFSERALYNTGAKDITSVFNIAKTTGVIVETTTIPSTVYPTVADIQKIDPNFVCNPLSPAAMGYIEIKNYDWYADQKKSTSRVKITWCGVTPLKNADGTYNINAIKSQLLKYGPLIVYTYKPSDTDHCMLLYGWEGTNFLFKDSYPCNPTIKRAEAVTNFTTFDMYAITSITKETYNESIWNKENPVKLAFSLNYDNDGVNDVADNKDGIAVTLPVSLNKSCFNSGTFSLNLTDIAGARVYNWQMVNPGGVTLSVSADTQTCTLSGYGSAVTLIAIVKRSNGLLEKIQFPIGTVGITVDKVSAYCSGNNYEITTKILHSEIAGATYTYNYNIPPLQNSSYAIVNGRFAYWVFKAPETVTFTASATCKLLNSSVQKSITSFLYSLPCGSYYKSASEEISDNKTIDENKPFIYPNPASNKITINSIGEGINNVKIYDITGNIVFSGQFEYSTEIELSRLSKGMYFVECFINNKEFLYHKEKLIIK